MGIGSQIRKRRKELKISRNILAERVHVTPSAIANYENGISYPKLDIFILLMHALHIDANYLFSGFIPDDITGSFAFKTEVTQEEHEVLEHYFSLPKPIRSMIDSIIEKEYETYHTTTLSLHILDNIFTDHKRIQAEAGSIPSGTDFCVQLENNTYLPFFKKYDILAFSRRDPEENEIGLYKFGNDYALKIVHHKEDSIILSSLCSGEEDIPFIDSRDQICYGVFIDKIFGEFHVL